MAWLLTENINMSKFINCHIAKCQVCQVYLAYLRYFDDTVTTFGEMLSINMPTPTTAVTHSTKLSTLVGH